LPLPGLEIMRDFRGIYLPVFGASFLRHLAIGDLPGRRRHRPARRGAHGGRAFVKSIVSI
jgi:hypothetical protein